MGARYDHEFSLAWSHICHTVEYLHHWTGKLAILYIARWMSRDTAMPISPLIAWIGVIEIVVNVPVFRTQELDEKWLDNRVIEQAGEAHIGINNTRHRTIQLVS